MLYQRSLRGEEEKQNNSPFIPKITNKASLKHMRHRSIDMPFVYMPMKCYLQIHENNIR